MAIMDFFGKVPVLTTGAASISAFEQDRQFHYIWFGGLDSPDRPPILWRVLSRNGNSQDYQDRKGNTLFEGGMLLLSENVVGTYPLNGEIRRNELTKFYEDESKWKELFMRDGEWKLENPALVWQNSDARKWCQHFEEVCFTEAERGYILSTFKSDREYHAKRDAYNPSLPPIPAAENILNGDRVFFLSIEEAENNQYGFKDKKVYTAEQEWWTRSFDKYIEYGETSQYLEVGIVLTHFGGLLCSPVTTKMYARPAMNLHFDKILFSCAAIGGKETSFPQAQVPAVLKKVPRASKRRMKEWKLTVLDESREAFSAEITKTEGKVLTVSYHNAVPYDSDSAPNERISMIITDSVRTGIKYYGNIALPVSAEGEAQIDLSSAELKSGDCLFVFSEQCNGDKRTDFAGRPKKLDF